MKLPQNKYIKWNYLAFAFFIPTLLFMGVMLFGGYEPFGNNRSMLYSDMYHQYYPFFLEFRNTLRSGKSLLYSWTIGMGLDYLGLVSYYLASPLNLLSVLVPEDLVLEYFSLLVPIKLGLASLFFAIFLKKIFNKDDLSISLFGAFYGLCAWALGFQWNVMWLDTFALLPLVALGTVYLLRDKKFILYTISLFLSIYANYYIGLFTCIFVLLLFICYEICRFQGFAKLFTDLLRIALFSILAIGMTAILELPALAALQTTQSSANSFPQGFRLNIADENTWKGLLDAMRQVAGNIGGGLEPNFKEGLPNLYSGVGTITLAFLYLTCRKIKLRDKICAVLLLLFFMVSFIIRQLDYIWHGFHFTNMIPYRFSFLFSFVMLYMAYRAFLLRRHFKLWQIILSGVLTIGIFVCSENRTDPVFIAYNLVFFILYMAALIYPACLKKLPKDANGAQRRAYKDAKLQRRKLAVLSLAGIMAAELLVNVINFGLIFPYTGISNYPSGKEDSVSVIDHMKTLEADSLFYRAEVTHSQTLNDGALNGYNGISTFTSSANVRVTEFMKALGYGAKNTYNRYCFEESSPIANLFLNLKYMIDRTGVEKENSYFDDVYSSGDIHLLRNNAYLPLGFLAEIQLTNVDFSSTGNRFVFQDRLLSSASGIRGTYWNRVSKDCVQITSEDVQVVTQSGPGYCTYKAGTSSGTISYLISSKVAGIMCIDFNLPKRNSFTVSLNGEKLYSESYSLPQMLAVADVKPGDVVQIDLTCKANEDSNMTVSAAILDDELFRQAYNVLSASTLALTKFTGTKVEGTIDCNRDGLLYTSIPQNGNWSVKVDGKKADIVLVGNAMISVPLTAGNHTVTFTYRNGAFSLGWKTSLLCVLIFTAITFAVYKPRRKKGKYEK